MLQRKATATASVLKTRAARACAQDLEEAFATAPLALGSVSRNTAPAVLPVALPTTVSNGTTGSLTGAKDLLSLAAVTEALPEIVQSQAEGPTVFDVVEDKSIIVLPGAPASAAIISSALEQARVMAIQSPLRPMFAARTERRLQNVR